MKTSTTVLIVSVALNGAIALAMWLDEPDDDDIVTATTVPGDSVPGSEPGAETWHALEAGSLAEQRDRLAATGMPPQIVRAILTAQVRETFAARRKALTDAQGDIPFWKNQARDPQAATALRELGRQEQKVLRDLLGRDPREDDPSYAAYLQRQFGNLPPEKAEQLRQIMDDYNERRIEITGNTRGGAMLPDERRKYQDLDKAMHDEFATVLTPQELFEYDLRSSNVASQVRGNLAAFDATEQEYIGLFKLQQVFEDKFSMMAGPLSADQAQVRMAAQRQLNDDIKAMLGPARYTEYERASDYGYRQASQLVARLNLPAETATTVYNVQKDAMADSGRIRGDRSLAPDIRSAQLDALAAATEAKLTTSLGSAGFEAYRQNGMGSWMTILRPPPPPGAGPATGR